MNVKNLVNPKLEDAFNILNVNRTLLIEKELRLLSKAKVTLEDGNLRGCSFYLSKINFQNLPPSYRADYFNLKLDFSQNQGNFLEAIRFGKVVCRLYQKLKDDQNYAQALLKLGDNYRQIEKFEIAIKYYGKVISIFSRRKNKEFDRFVSDAYIGQGMCLRGLGRWNQAQKLFNICLKKYIKNHDREGQAYTLWAIGTTFRFSGNILSAESFLRKSLNFYKKIKDDNSVAYTRCGLGGTLRMKGFPRESLVLYQKAYKFFHANNDEFGMAYSSCGQGNAHRMMGRLKQALPFMNRAIKKYTTLKQKGPLGYVLWSRAQLNILRGNFLQAQQDLKKSQSLFKLCGDKRGEVYCLLGWGEFNSKKNLSALLYFKKAFSIGKKLKLNLETGHAASRINLENSKKIYSTCGVSLKAYLQYKGFP